MPLVRISSGLSYSLPQTSHVWIPVWSCVSHCPSRSGFNVRGIVLVLASRRSIILQHSTLHRSAAIGKARLVGKEQNLMSSTPEIEHFTPAFCHSPHLASFEKSTGYVN